MSLYRFFLLIFIPYVAMQGCVAQEVSVITQLEVVGSMLEENDSRICTALSLIDQRNIKTDEERNKYNLYKALCAFFYNDITQCSKMLKSIKTEYLSPQETDIYWEYFTMVNIYGLHDKASMKVVEGLDLDNTIQNENKRAYISALYAMARAAGSNTDEVESLYPYFTKAIENKEVMSQIYDMSPNLYAYVYAGWFSAFGLVVSDGKLNPDYEETMRNIEATINALSQVTEFGYEKTLQDVKGEYVSYYLKNQAKHPKEIEQILSEIKYFNTLDRTRQTAALKGYASGLRGNGFYAESNLVYLYLIHNYEKELVGNLSVSKWTDFNSSSSLTDIYHLLCSNYEKLGNLTEFAGICNEFLKLLRKNESIVKDIDLVHDCARMLKKIGAVEQYAECVSLIVPWCKEMKKMPNQIREYPSTDLSTPFIASLNPKEKLSLYQDYYKFFDLSRKNTILSLIEKKDASTHLVKRMKDIFYKWQKKWSKLGGDYFSNPFVRDYLYEFIRFDFLSDEERINMYNEYRTAFESNEWHKTSLMSNFVRVTLEVAECYKRKKDFDKAIGMYTDLITTYDGHISPGWEQIIRYSRASAYYHKHINGYHLSDSEIYLFSDDFSKYNNMLEVERYMRTLNAANREYYWYRGTGHNLNFDICRTVLTHYQKDPLGKLYNNTLFEKGLFLRLDADSKLVDYKWRNVQQELNEDDVAIEYIWCRAFPQANIPVDTLDAKYGSYYALVLRKDCQCPKVIKLGRFAEIHDELLKPGGMRLDRYINRLYSDGNPQMYHGEKLYNLIWKPIEEELKGVHNIYYAPTGILNNISFQTLCHDSIPLIDRYNLYLCSSTREIENIKKGMMLEQGQASIYGGIQYTADANDMIAEANKYKKDTIADVSSQEIAMRSGWNYLPGTRTETINIEKLLNGNNITTTRLEGLGANEESFKSLSGSSPELIHLATHGFYISDVKDIRQNAFLKDKGVNEDNTIKPLFCSGMLLAGANATWLGNGKAEGIEDGILTAAEVAEMDLENTKLVALSACETGLGMYTITNHEGVYGLQRAFKIAGVKTIIMSLWKVPDSTTSELMQNFYDRWTKGEEVHDAFNNAKREIRNKYPQPYQWAGFVMLD